MKILKYSYYLPCLLIFVMSCGGEKKEKKEIVRPVMYQKVVPGGGVQERTFSGTAKSGTETKLSFKVAGNIESLRVKVGEEVLKNTLIATLDDSDFQLQYEQADASVKNADAQEKQAKSAYERVRALYENGSTSISEYESAKAAYESARANESSAKKQRKLSKAQLGYTRLYSPLRGKIATVDAEVTDDLGFIEFKGLPTGDYKLILDIPGVGEVSAIVGVMEGEMLEVTALIDDEGALLEVDQVLSTVPLAELEVSIYPNPVTTYLLIEFPPSAGAEAHTVRLYDLEGRLLQSHESIDRAVRLDVSEARSGVMLLQIHQGDQVLRKRILKLK